TPAQVVSSPEGPPNLIFKVPDVTALAGFLADVPTVTLSRPNARDAAAAPVTLGPATPAIDNLTDEPQAVRQYSLRQLHEQPAVVVPAGPTKVRLALPWGNWITQISVPADDEAYVSLPAAVGTVQPLRIRLYQLLTQESRKSMLFGIDGPSPSSAA